jgi:hypothetical protein
MKQQLGNGHNDMLLKNKIKKKKTIFTTIIFGLLQKCF